MPQNNASVETTSKKSRPLGILVLTIFGLFFGGIYPLSFEPLDLLMGHTAFYSSKDIPTIKMIAFLNMAIILASILTWKGSIFGKNLFLFFIAALFVWDGIVSFSWGSHIPRLNDIQGWLIYIVDFGFPLLCIWYFNRPSTKEFYRQVEKVKK